MTIKERRQSSSLTSAEVLARRDPRWGHRECYVKPSSSSLLLTSLMTPASYYPFIPQETGRSGRQKVEIGNESVTEAAGRGSVLKIRGRGFRKDSDQEA